FTGVIPSGVLANPIPAGYSLKASRAPLSGGISSTLGLLPHDFALLTLFNENTQSSDSYSFDPADGFWDPDGPIVQLAHCFWFFSASGENWMQNFQINSSAVAAAVPIEFTPTEAAATASILCPVGPARLSIAPRRPSQVDVSWP